MQIMVKSISIGLFLKKIHNPPTEEISATKRGGGDCLKNVLNLYRMHREGGGIVNFHCRGEGNLFWNNLLSTGYGFSSS